RAQCRLNDTELCVVPVCAVVNCSDPGHVENGVRHSGLRYPEVFSYGITVAFHCKRGFYLLGSALLTCQHDGRWDRPVPRCLGMLTPTARITSEKLFILQNIIKIQLSVYRTFNTSKRVGKTCNEDGTWSGAPPYCTGVSPGICGDPGMPPHGARLGGEEFKTKSLLRFSCEAGFNLIGSVERTCLHNGTWSGTQPVCQVIHCGPPPQVLHGKVEGSDYSWGSSVSYSCFHGYQLSSPTVLACEGNGTWTGDVPQCLRKSTAGAMVLMRLSAVFPIAHSCRQPETPSNVDVRSMDLPTLGYTLIYTCQEGFYLAGGSEHRTCKSDGRWSGKPPLCKGITLSQKYSCLKWPQPQKGRHVNPIRLKIHTD
uniref:Sushi domain-containing protein n=1 Tax=Periophthalmus magnuspinnatus TaxID=409849 RepID=A0A3B3Z8B6_9GOBI